MGTLGWKIYRPAGLVVVRGVGVFDLSFATAFRETMRAEGAVGYCKLFDLSRADIQLSSDDLNIMAASTRLTGPTIAGPIAILVGRTPPPLLVDMAVLLKHRIGDRRRLRLFTDETDAREWLASEGPAPGLAGEPFPLLSRAAENDSRPGY
ncbi:MAG: hypothetical protein EPO41_03245 [Reyranella sp.]|uniref:hypothetical protein n=1 Tax=Reyranella sp. TaxID=1929291 RepID=UPI001223ED19|nr:hypothetical protein [Reyranella sp.]TAJ97434.1 MAG: hypothetical protein EPO41_03245 [Reyranella sp.]